MKKHSVTLTPQERKKLVAMVTTGRNKATVIQRAHTLLKSAEGKTDAEIATLLYISEQTVRRTRVRFCGGGLDVALEDKPYPKPAPKLNVEQEAYLIALACSGPPAGRARWTLELLAQQLVQDSIVDGIASETVRLVLKKTNSSLGR